MGLTERGKWANASVTERGNTVINKKIIDKGQVVFGLNSTQTPTTVNPISFFANLSTYNKIMILRGSESMFSIGNGYIGSASLQTSTTNMELIPSKPAGWSDGYKLYKFSFVNDQACHVVVNGKWNLYLRDGQGFNIELGDKHITSFVIVEGGITFNWIGAY